jgi:hypothetical protein
MQGKGGAQIRTARGTRGFAPEIASLCQGRRPKRSGSHGCALCGRARRSPVRHTKATDSLYKLAIRIQARAIQRCGELLQQVLPNPGVRAGADPNSFTRKSVATTAGLSDRQRKTALRVANVSDQEFEQAVEAESPDTVTALAEAGRRPRTPGDSDQSQSHPAVRPIAPRGVAGYLLHSPRANARFDVNDSFNARLSRGNTSREGPVPHRVPPFGTSSRQRSLSA